MKKLLFYMIALLICTKSVQASEFFGRISTNPNAFVNNTTASSGNNATTNANLAIGSSNTTAVEPPVKSVETKKISIKQISVASTSPVIKKKGQNEVLGAKIYDNALIRNPQGNIYYVKGSAKKLIHGLKELEKYRGWRIYDVSDDYVFQYQMREHFDGELIREKGMVKIYVLKNGVKEPVISLAELRARYFGLKINNLSREEMKSYDN